MEALLVITSFKITSAECVRFWLARIWPASLVSTVRLFRPSALFRISPPLVTLNLLYWLCDRPAAVGAWMLTTVVAVLLGAIATEALELLMGMALGSAAMANCAMPARPKAPTTNAEAAPPECERAISHATTHKPVFLFLTMR